MVRSTLEERVAGLETRLSQVQEELRIVRRETKDWRRKIGAFTDGLGMREILQEAMRMRESDRKQARNKARKRKS